MQTTIGTTPVTLESFGRPVVIQNLGPGTVYFDFEGTASEEDSFKLESGDLYECPASAAGSPFSVVSTQADTDLRWNRLGY